LLHVSGIPGHHQATVYLVKTLHCIFHCIETVALEAETAISNLDVTEQNYYRYAVAGNIKNISRKDNITNKRNKEEWKLITNIKNEMIINRITITKADKGNTLVIATQEEYKQNKQLYTWQPIYSD
jgi:hypothetical protein